MGERDALLSSFADSARSSTDGSGDATVHVQTGQQQRHREKRNANAGNGLNGFNVLFLKRFWRLVHVVFPRVCCKSLLLLGMLIFTQSAEEYNIYLTGLIPSQFIYALDIKSVVLFKSVLWMSAVTVISVSICKSASLLLASLLYVHGRGLIVKHLHHHYFKGINYYHINVTHHTIDNPDQRMTQDVDKWCDQVTQVLPNIILSPGIIAYYTYKTFQSMGYIGPLCIFAYFLLSSVVNKFLMSCISSLIVRQEKLEGDFRYHHTQVRTNAESIAFYRGGKIEAENSNNLLQVLLKTQLSVMHWQFPLNLSTSVFDYAASVISYFLVGVAVFTSDYDDMSVSELSAAISRNAFFSMYLLNNFSTVVDTASKFSDIAGYTHRIGEMMEFLELMFPTSGTVENNQSYSINSQRRASGVSQSSDVALVFENLSVVPPHQSSPLIEGLSMKLRKGENLLVLGDTGCGKSSILRVLRGLWRPLRGHATLCCGDNPHSIMFLPQKSYLTRGSLLDQVTFPQRPKRCQNHGRPLCTSSYQSVSDSRIQNALSLAGLVPLVDRLGGVDTNVRENWYDIISPGEMQKIGFARLFFHQPHYAVLDEATSSLSEENEAYFYTTLRQLNITVLTVGHRSTLQKFHSQSLHIYSSKNWILQDIVQCT